MKYLFLLLLGFLVSTFVYSTSQNVQSIRSDGTLTTFNVLGGDSSTIAANPSPVRTFAARVETDSVPTVEQEIGGDWIVGNGTSTGTGEAVYVLNEKLINWGTVICTCGDADESGTTHDCRASRDASTPPQLVIRSYTLTGSLSDSDVNLICVSQIP